jgi:hypothetical protein
VSWCAWRPPGVRRRAAPPLGLQPRWTWRSLTISGSHSRALWHFVKLHQTARRLQTVQVAAYPLSAAPGTYGPNRQRVTAGARFEAAEFRTMLCDNSKASDVRSSPLG